MPTWATLNRSMSDDSRTGPKIFECQTLTLSGNLLGFSLENAQWNVETLVLNQADKIVMYTSGLTENIQDLPTRLSKRAIVQSVRSLGAEDSVGICAAIEPQ